MGLLLLIMVSLMACAPTAPNDTPPAGGALPTEESDDSAGNVDLIGPQWQLISFGSAGAEIPVVGDSAVTLMLGEDGQLSGSGGCNSYGGGYEIDNNTLSVAQIASTLMACADEQLMQQEIDYLAALQTGMQFAVNGDQLTLSSPDGQVVLNFVAS
jgi:heat shock protein HslJ